MKKENLIKELNSNELATVNGGFDPISVTALIISAFALVYQMGKDRAEADRRMN